MSSRWEQIEATRKPLASELKGKFCWRIPLTQGKFAFVSDLDITTVSEHHWSAKRDHNVWYALTNIRQPDGTYKVLALHLLVGERIGIVGPVDHESGDGLDCRRENLRAGPELLNQANRRKLQTRETSSAFKGVYWNKDCCKWHVQIRIDGKRYHLGLFTDETEAARTYDSAALAAWGEYAQLNFPLLAKTG